MSAKEPVQLRLIARPPQAERERTALQSSGFFVGANLAAGVLNYFYQMLASRQLPLLEYSALNAWYANLALFFALPSLLQYAANFFPQSRTRLRVTLLAANFTLILFAALWFTSPSGIGWIRAALVVAAAALVAWVNGQAQGRMLMGALALAGLATAAAKLALAAMPLSSGLETFAAAVFLAYAPALWWLSLSLWRQPDVSGHDEVSWRHWMAPLILSVTSAVFPQMDLVILNQTLPAETFAPFALASLFCKAIFFLALAYLQWLLPHQMQGKIESPSSRATIAFAVFGLGLSAIAALSGPPLAAAILGWHVLPPALMIFLSCVNACLLTWMFLRVQNYCTTGQLRAATAILAMVLAEALVQLWLHLLPTGYLVLAIVWQVFTLAYATSVAARHAPAARSPPRLRPVR